jgi:hypothetical protein
LVIRQKIEWQALVGTRISTGDPSRIPGVEIRVEIIVPFDAKLGRSRDLGEAAAGAPGPRTGEGTHRPLTSA